MSAEITVMEKGTAVVGVGLMTPDGKVYNGTIERDVEREVTEEKFRTTMVAYDHYQIEEMKKKGYTFRTIDLDEAMEAIKERPGLQADVKSFANDLGAEVLARLKAEQERDALKAENERLRDALRLIVAKSFAHGDCGSIYLRAIAKDALTPPAPPVKDGGVPEITVKNLELISDGTIPGDPDVPEDCEDGGEEKGGE